MRLQLKYSGLLSLLGLSVLASAQDISYRQIMLGQKILYALQKDYRDELKLSQMQVDQIVDAFEGAVTVEDDRIMLMIRGEVDLPAMEKKAMKALDETQRKRIRELFIQQQGGIALADEEIAKELGLTEKQNKELDRLLQLGAEDMQGIFTSGGHDESTQKAAKSSQEECGKKMAAVLSDDQKKAFEKMKGVPFKKKDKKDGGGVSR